VTGFGLAGHLFNIARASNVEIEVDAGSLPCLPGVQRMVGDGHTTGGALKNAAFVGDSLEFQDSVPKWLRAVVLDPQTSGGLALFSSRDLSPMPEIGRVRAGIPKVRVLM
jgi:selenide,water dikinase